MAKIAYVDHSYHKKTLSTQFIPDMLRGRGHTVDFFWDEAWEGGAAIPFERVSDYDVVIMFQSRCEIPSGQYFRKLHPNVIYISMLDGLHIPYGPHTNFSRYWEPFQGCKVISFSSALHAVATSFGLRSFFIRYYQPPAGCVPPAGGGGPRAFFWLRHEKHVSWPVIRMLLEGTSFEAVHLHIAPDPTSPEPELPTGADRKKFNITTSTWFAEKRDFLDVLEGANIFFAPRRAEGIGQSFLEAMARGQCVVAPDEGTMNEYIIHGVNGLLYHAEHPAPLDFSRFAELGKAARQSVAIGYECWLAAKDRLEEFILAPCAQMYRGFYQHPLRTMQSMRQRIRNTAVVRKTERIWLPIWRRVKRPRM